MTTHTGPLARSGAQSPTGAVRSRHLSWVEPACLLWSAATAGIGGWWLLDGGRFPATFLDERTESSLVARLDPSALSWLMLVLGLVGVGTVLTAMAMLDRPSRRPLTFLALGLAVAFGPLASDLSVIVAAGYLSAILGPPVLLVVLLAGARRDRRSRLVLAGVLVALVGAAAAFGVRPDSLVDFGGNLGEGLQRSGMSMLFSVVAFAGGVLWLSFAARNELLSGVLARHWPRVRRVPAAPVPNWVRGVTFAAALCPLPYGLLRMTWLTPWPVWTSRELLEADPALRVFGLFLGLAAIGGSVLIVGLVSRWGEVYPRWVPVLRGRVVSPVWPTALALLVGGAITIAGRSMVQMVLAETSGAFTAEALLIFPFPAWGPLLAAAAIGYYLRRTRPLPATRGEV